MAKPIITHQQLLELLHYDPLTGIFTWKIARGNVRAGATAGTDNGTGYLVAKVLGRMYRLNRLAWFYVHGQWPAMVVDHQDEDKQNNRLANLRDVSHSTNRQNISRASARSTSGLLGGQVPRRGRPRSQIRIGGKAISLGTFATPEEASAAHMNAKRQLHPGYVEKEGPPGFLPAGL